MEILNKLEIIDMIFVAILSISVIVGLIRGVVREVLSLVSLFVSIFLAFRFADFLSTKYVGRFIESEQISYVASFVLIIICSLFVFALFNLLISQLLKASGLSYLDRLLGIIFGVVRGTIICCVIVLVVGFVPGIKDKDWWQSSKMVPVFKSVAHFSLQFFPEKVGQYFETSDVSIMDLAKDATKKTLSPDNKNDSSIEKTGSTDSEEANVKVNESAKPTIELESADNLDEANSATELEIQLESTDDALQEKIDDSKVIQSYETLD